MASSSPKGVDRRSLRAWAGRLPGARAALRWVRRTRAWFEDWYVRIRYRRNGQQAIEWQGLIVSETSDDPYVRKIAFGRDQPYRLQNAVFRALISGPSPVVMDIGANIGVMSMLLSRIPGSTVYAFEPVARAFACLRHNVEQNHLDNVHALQFGLSDAAGTRFIGLPSGRQHSRYGRSVGSDDRKTGLYSVYAQPDTAAGEVLGEWARFETLDEFCEREQIGRIDYIKIDVEGHETNVLEGGRVSLRRFRPICQVEFNTTTLQVSGKRYDELFGLLERLDYRPFALDGGVFRAVALGDLLASRSEIVVDLYAVPRGQEVVITRASERIETA